MIIYHHINLMVLGVSLVYMPNQITRKRQQSFHNSMI